MVKRSVSQGAWFIFRALWMICPFVVLSLAASPALGQPSAQGDWVKPINGSGDGYGWELIAYNAALLSTGKVLVWDTFVVDETPSKLWNPADGSFTNVPPHIEPTPGMHCAGFAHLADGSLAVAGGAPAEGSFFMRDELTIFRLNGPDPWEQGALMNYQRWYPTATMLPDGRMLVVAGLGEDADPLVEQPEIYNPSTDQWVEIDVETDTITPQYPFMFVMPDGRIFNAGGGHESPPPPPPYRTYVLDVDAPSWTEFPQGDDSFLPGIRGAAVMYEPGKVLKCGGVRLGGTEEQITPQTAMIGTTENPDWATNSLWDMPEARKDHHLVLLPDGQILLVGGRDDTDYFRAAAMFNPSNPGAGWVNMAVAAKKRGHHSVALLLPDATVLSAAGFDGASAEIFRPPYLYTGTPTPKIGYAPTAVGYGQEFTVIVGGIGITPGDIDKVTLLRPASVTHWLDQDQRFLSLDIGPAMGVNSLSVTAPANANLAPPGYYMLFVVSNAGVPSKASWIRVWQGQVP